MNFMESKESQTYLCDLEDYVNDLTDNYKVKDFNSASYNDNFSKVIQIYQEAMNSVHLMMANAQDDKRFEEDMQCLEMLNKVFDDRELDLYLAKLHESGFEFDTLELKHYKRLKRYLRKHLIKWYDIEIWVRFSAYNHKDTYLDLIKLVQCALEYTREKINESKV